MKDNPLLRLEALGQSLWSDYIRRNMLSSGELQHLIEQDGLAGVTSNPSIFEKAIAGSHDYDDAIRALALADKSVQEIYQALTVDDIQRAADIFRPVYDRLDGADGFVSIEVSPNLAYDTTGTVVEARRLWKAVQHPNVMIKVPATREGLLAIRQLTSEGINVNVTLLFGLPRYREVADAYIAGLEERTGRGEPVDHIASVASFFLSRIDVLVDLVLEKNTRAGSAEAKIVSALHGEVAVASAKVAYQIYQEIFGSDRFRRLADRGARPQRLLWASTSTKNPAYSDIKYVDALIGPETIDTAPLETINAYRDHGNPALRLEEDVAKAREVLERLPQVGIDLDAVTQQLEREGVQKFIDAFDRLKSVLEEKRAAALREPVDGQILDLGDQETKVQKRIGELSRTRFGARLWRKDPALWTGDPKEADKIRDSLGWLHVVEKMEENLADLSDFAEEVRAAGFRHVLHVGMGGSSLAPLVFERTFAPGPKGLPLTVLDTTDPATILEIERKIPLADTLFVVATKSGTTTEPLVFAKYFYAKVEALKGNRAEENFVAITDPGTPLVELAQKQRYRRTFLNFPDIGGRYSALSYFGLVPAALMDLDTPELLARALRMVHACASCVPLSENPGIVMGAVLGELARHGRDKVTLLLPKPIEALGMWLEQLLAESTGKDGKGLLPVAGEPVGAPSTYGDDRLFVHIRLKGEVDRAVERSAAILQEAGHPVVTIQMDDRLDLAQEFFRWEIATAAAGAILGINPFDQPNVQESKSNTERLLAEVQRMGRLPEVKPVLVEGPLSLYARESAGTVSNTLAQFLAASQPGDYVALLAYLPENLATKEQLQALRMLLRDRLHLATTADYGPRYLHSTGQLHKGGPNTGFFLLLTAEDAQDAPIPGEPYTFAVLKRAQAQGDLEALQRHRRRVLHVDLGTDVIRGLKALKAATETALAVMEQAA